MKKETLFTVKKLKDNPGFETIRIAKGKIDGLFRVFTFKDNNVWMYYIPSLEISGYGKTKLEAKNMMEFCLKDLFQNYSINVKKKVDNDLIKLGWKRNIIKNKVFSKVYVDSKGLLKNFKVESLQEVTGEMELTI